VARPRKAEPCGRVRRAPQGRYLPQLSRIPGFVTASILRRDVGNGIEFLIVTHWESIGAIEQFAGRDPEVAVVPRRVQDMMIEYERTVRHYEIVSA
jgi:heme-degrading monooxygenase HmoA